MDEFAGPDKGWNDPDMLVIGMDGITETMCRSHMAMWCMMNSPLMLGLDLRRVEKGDWIYNIIANEDLIALDQDPLGVQAKRIFTTYPSADPSKDYIRDNNRVDVLAKPLSNGDFALAFFNLASSDQTEPLSISFEKIINAAGGKMDELSKDRFRKAARYTVRDLLEKNTFETGAGLFTVNSIAAYGSRVFRITPET